LSYGEATVLWGTGLTVGTVEFGSRVET